MDVNQVLTSTLSTDAATRQSAEQQLLHAAEVDFATYLTTLAGELANEAAAPTVRIAAGIALKNSFTFRELDRLREVQGRWVHQLSPEIKKTVKELALKTLKSDDARAGQSAAQLIAVIAAIELPRNEWPELMDTLVKNVNSGSDHMKQASLTTIGFICESDEPELRESLSAHSNAILTAVVQGARREETNAEVRNAALTALGDAMEFVRSNFENDGERNYIMQVVCEATQAEDTRIQSGAFGCLNRIMGLYYEKMRFYMEKALFGLTILGMKNEEEDVAKLAIEFWCTVCEEEIAIEDDNAAAQAEGSTEIRPFFGFARIACREVVPVLLHLMTKQDEDAADDDYDTSRAAYQALQLYAQCVAAEVIPPVLTFVEENLRSEDWHRRDAAVSAFGAIMDGPDAQTLDPLIKQALPVLIGMMDDKVIHVKDSAAYALGRICDYCSESIDPEAHLQPLISCLFHGLASNPKIAGSCCWALMNLAERFAGEAGAQTNPLSKHFQDSVTSLLTVTERHDTDNQLRTAAYEVLNSFVTNAANDSLPIVANLSDVILQRLEQTVPMQQQVVSVEDRITLEEMQTSLTSVLLAIVQRLEGEIKPQADRIMHVLLQVLSTVPPKSSVPDTVFATVGSIASALEGDFIKYMDSFIPFLYNALGNQEEAGLCAMAIGLVSDITRSLSEKAQPYCDTFMNHLLNNLRSTTLSNQLKPSILETFGDIAQAIGLHFETYLVVVAGVLQQASGVTASPDVSYDMLDYIVSLREGIMDAWGGILLAYKGTPNANGLQPYVESIFQLLNIIAQDNNRSEGLLRASMGVIGDLADTFPNGEFAALFRNDFVSNLIRETRTNREFGPRTIETARWAREQVKRQIGLATAQVMS
ncbi:importin subunit beta-1 [Histoplasma capsulatum G186AR]|uniref:Importin-95 n=3 Tax=Ajellomyces capsulatus TaxID=5037 RepID=C0NEP5_AJECG|nr:importin subunit beta-1 [Histoplasma capsulatum G186AR]EEH09716.1 importin subunit beta-1 [Histoplasma capsulatum G186AR]KAG5288862.1 importin subunit beta-1 [Histoplasma capsulatum]QSS54967.1 importin subunit beta-1 [Histoplasma capsulatum var. duboisii H88]QSS73265.1 importin subunit beta-1 [Histoplasma capsulatum G186AR]